MTSTRETLRSPADPLSSALVTVAAGTVLLKPVLTPDARGEIEIGWHLHPDRWGHGLATEAAAAILATLPPERRAHVKIGPPEKAAEELSLMDDTKKDIVYEMGLLHDAMGQTDKAVERFIEHAIRGSDHD